MSDNFTVDLDDAPDYVEYEPDEIGYSKRKYVSFNKSLEELQDIAKVWGQYRVNMPKPDPGSLEDAMSLWLRMKRDSVETLHGESTFDFGTEAWDESCPPWVLGYLVGGLLSPVSANPVSDIRTASKIGFGVAQLLCHFKIGKCPKDEKS